MVSINTIYSFRTRPTSEGYDDADGVMAQLMEEKKREDKDKDKKYTLTVGQILQLVLRALASDVSHQIHGLSQGPAAH